MTAFDLTLAPRSKIRQGGSMATKKAEASAEDHPPIIGRNWGVSVSLATVLIGGIASNLLMFSTLKQEVAVFGTDLKNQTQDVTDIKTSVRELISSTKKDLDELRHENMLLRERVTKLEAQAGK